MKVKLFCVIQSGFSVHGVPSPILLWRSEFSFQIQLVYSCICNTVLAAAYFCPIRSSPAFHLLPICSLRARPHQFTVTQKTYTEHLLLPSSILSFLRCPLNTAVVMLSESQNYRSERDSGDQSSMKLRPRDIGSFSHCHPAYCLQNW